MRRIILLLFSIAICYNSFAQSYELLEGDTINKKDINNKRQGRWLIKANPSKNPGFSPRAVVAEGYFKDSRKEGVWKSYFPNGKLKSEITYERSRPRGAYTLYYDNGNVEEKGIWERTKNTGDFKRFHENGKVSQDFTFTESGKSSGEQKYYYENGQLRLVGTWQEGQETGEMREYYENGDLMAVKNFNAGVLDKESYQSYAPKTPQKDPLEKQMAEGKEMKVTAAKDERPNQGAFDGNGYKKLYNRNRQIAKDGIFKNYRLMDGKQFKYDDNGLLLQIMIFKNGKYIGDGVIEES